MAMKENSKKVLEYLKTINGQDVTAADVAEALGLEKRSVDGIFTSAIQRKGLASALLLRLSSLTALIRLLSSSPSLRLVWHSIPMPMLSN
jgi:transcriptional regulator GlxA family with amidase domain